MTLTVTRWLALLVATVLGSILIVHQSALALTTDADVGGATTGAPLVTDATGPLFGGEPLAPGQSTSRCVEISYRDGPSAAEVRMLADVTDHGLGPWLQVTIELGEGGQYGDCAGFSSETTSFAGTLSELGTHDRFDRGIGAWSIASGGTRSYRITTTLLDGAPVGTTADADFHWEVRAP